MEVWDAPCLSINCGQDSHAGQVQYGQLSFDFWLIPVFTICHECSVVKATFLQGSTSTAGAILTYPEGHARSILNCILSVYEYLVL